MGCINDADDDMIDYLKSKCTSAEWKIWNRLDMYYWEEENEVAIIGYFVYSGKAYFNVFYSDSYLLIKHAAEEIYMTDTKITMMIIDTYCESEKYALNYIKQAILVNYDNEDLVKDISIWTRKLNFMSIIPIQFSGISTNIGKNISPPKNANCEIAPLNISYDDNSFKIDQYYPVIIDVGDNWSNTDDIIMFMKWKNEILISGTVRWNKLKYFSLDGDEDSELEILFVPWLNYKLLKQVYIKKRFDKIMRYESDIDYYHNEWYKLHDAIAYILVKILIAARRIQRYYKRSISNPQYKLCKRRLNNEFKELSII